MPQLARCLTFTLGQPFPSITLCCKLICEPLEPANPGSGLGKRVGLCRGHAGGIDLGSVRQVHNPTVAALAVRLLSARKLPRLETPAHGVDRHA